MNTSSSIVFTGCGILSASSSSFKDFIPDNKGTTPITAFDAQGLKATHAGEVKGFNPLDYVSPVQVRTIDRATVMAIAAVKEALKEIAPELPYDETGIAIGTSGACQHQNFSIPFERKNTINRRSALYNFRYTPLFQAEMLSRYFGFGGPRLAFGCASVGGLMALGHARNLLIAGHAEAMVVGGGETNTLINSFCMDSLGLTCKGPSSPLDLSDGFCLGEGAVFFVLERLETALSRGAKILGELGAVSITSDACTNFGFNPGGIGVANALQGALSRENLSTDSIGWIRPCCTGQRPMDYAEANGIGQVFQGFVPPACQTETLFGHVNGISPLLGTAAILWAFENNISPAPLYADIRLNKRPLSPMKSRDLPEGPCLLSAMALGGFNGATIIKKHKENSQYIAKKKPERDVDIIISGLGIITCRGVSVDALTKEVSVDTSETQSVKTQLVDDKFLEVIDGRRFKKQVYRLSRMAIFAVQKSLDDANIKLTRPCRTGLLVGLSRAPTRANEKITQAIQSNSISKSFGVDLVKSSGISLANNLSAYFNLTSYTSVMSTGVNGGVQLLAHGVEILAADPSLDNLIVVAVDEWTETLASTYHRLIGKDFFLSEGAASIILKRSENIGKNDIVVKGISFAGKSKNYDTEQKLNEKNVSRVLERADISGEEIDFIYKQKLCFPESEEFNYNTICPNAKNINIVPYTGLLESAGGLISAAVATNYLRSNTNKKNHSLLLDGNEKEAYGAIILSVGPG